MRYVGGKGRIAKQLAQVIRDNTSAKTIYDPFMGGGSMTGALSGVFDEVISGDAHEDLVLMWNEALSGWNPPALSYEEYQTLRYSNEPSAIRGFAGYGGSFGGRWFEGFARGGYSASGEPRNHQAESSRAVVKLRDKMVSNGIETVFHKDYLAWPWDCVVGSAIYCDPPYARSQASKRYAVKFDNQEFWSWADGISERNDVFVSEYEAPPGWISIWGKEKRQSLVVGSGVRDLRTEKLFVKDRGQGS